MRRMLLPLVLYVIATMSSNLACCGAQAATTEAQVPAAVRIARPSAEEILVAKNALAAFVSSADPQVKQVLAKFPTLIEVRPPHANTAIVPDLARQFRGKHDANVVIAKEGKAEVLFLGDSITDFWRNENGPFAGKPIFDKYFSDWNVANFGIAGDTTQGVLYRLENGEGEGIKPRAIMLMIGTNNTGRNSAPEIAEGIGAVVQSLREHFPDAKVLLLGVFPRGSANDPVRRTIAEINALVAKLDDGEHIHYLDIGDKFLDDDGNIPRDIMIDGLHPSTKGYEIWAEAVSAPLGELAGLEVSSADN